jgi:hypothetical protein
MMLRCEDVSANQQEITDFPSGVLGVEGPHGIQLSFQSTMFIPSVEHSQRRDPFTSLRCDQEIGQPHSDQPANA